MFGDLFRQIYRAPLVMIKALLSNPLSLFVYGIMSKWYIMVMIPTIIITFWVFKGLEKSGVLQAAEATITKALVECKSIAQNCTPLIMDLPATWECIKNPPEYVPDANEIKLEKDVDEVMKQDNQNNVGTVSKPGSDVIINSSGAQNPYDQ